MFSGEKEKCSFNVPADILNGKPRDFNLAKGEEGDAAETRQGSCNPARPARVNDQSPRLLKNALSILRLKSNLPFLGNKYVQEVNTSCKNPFTVSKTKRPPSQVLSPLRKI